MSDLKTLYQDLILDHNRSPRNFRAIENPDRHAEGYNPLCGDHYTIFVKLADDVIEDVSFQGSGCAISKASASVMTTVLKGKRIAEAEVLFEKFHRLVKGEQNGKDDPTELGKMAVFSGVSEFPARVKCASLAWHAVHAALEKKESVSTE